jgi:hypothetical protein
MSVSRGGPREFEAWVKRMGKREVPDWVAQTARRAFIQLGDQVVLGTPVGDKTGWKNPESAPPGYTGGRARGGWQPTMHAPAADDVERIDKAGNVRKEGPGAVATFKVGDVAYWTNNTPYILRLVHGWSRQAPDGWVPRAVRQVANQFKRRGK